MPFGTLLPFLGFLALGLLLARLPVLPLGTILPVEARLVGARAAAAEPVVTPALEIAAGLEFALSAGLELAFATRLELTLATWFTPGLELALLARLVVTLLAGLAGLELARLALLALLARLELPELGLAFLLDRRLREAHVGLGSTVFVGVAV
ncbi:hypothetical protein WDZ92_54130, partial [Nostoc sp. NIES-2111]